MKYYVEFLNPNKKFKLDRKYFKTYGEARKWCMENMKKFDPDYIKPD